jgi:hypothetical protein
MEAAPQHLFKKIGGVPSGLPAVLTFNRLMARRMNEGMKYKF